MRAGVKLQQLPVEIVWGIPKVLRIKFATLKDQSSPSTGNCYPEEVEYL